MYRPARGVKGVALSAPRLAGRPALSWADGASTSATSIFSISSKIVPVSILCLPREESRSKEHSMPSGFQNQPKILRGAFVEYGLSIPPLFVVFQFNPVQLSR